MDGDVQVPHLEHFIEAVSAKGCPCKLREGTGLGRAPCSRRGRRCLSSSEDIRQAAHLTHAVLLAPLVLLVLPVKEILLNILEGSLGPRNGTQSREAKILGLRRKIGEHSSTLKLPAQFARKEIPTFGKGSLGSSGLDVC